MSRYKFPAATPRKMYWSDEAGGVATCPDCGGALESEHHTYVLATWLAGQQSIQAVGNTAGHFCAQCPVVVLDRRTMEQFVSLATRGAGTPDYIVMGIVDLDAVPEDKRHLPFDEETNPLPLVRFINLDEPRPGRRPDRRQRNQAKRKRQQQKKRKARKKKR